MEIIKEPNEILYKSSSIVKLPLSKEDQDLLNEMLSYIKDENNKAIGLSAVQVGVLKRMCVIRIKENKKTISYKLVNPRIISKSANMVEALEGCLSVEEHYVIKRNTSVSVMAYDAIQNKTIVINASGWLARVLQHEIDHMNGILISKGE